MKLGDFKRLVASCGDDWELDFADPNFDGPLDYYVNGDPALGAEQVEITPDKKQILLRIPCIEPLKD